MPGNRKMEYMNEPVDKLLTGRIRQVFEDLEDPSADAGWKALRKKYPERNRRPLILWLSSAAAVFVLAAGLWFIQQPEQLVAIKPTKEGKAVAKMEEPKPVTLKSIVEKGTAREDITGRSGIAKPVGQNLTIAVIQGSPETASGVARPVGQNLTIADIQGSPENAVREERKVSPLIVTAPDTRSLQNIRESELPKHAEPLKAAMNPITEKEILAIVPNDPVMKSSEVKEFNPPPVDGFDKKEDVKLKKKLGFSVYAGSYFNYSEGSENQLNFGAGVISDIRLSRNLKLSTGLSIASNSLNYNSGQDLPVNASSSFNSVKLSSGNLTTITSYHANLLVLDIPVNIKYQFVPESDKFYLSAGLSSGTYLNETYAYQYRNFNTASGNYVSQTADQKIKKQLNDFDLGRTLNLSLGLSTDFGKTQKISIEPFLKYPLGGLGSENLKFGSTGINLKLRFNPRK